MDSQIPNIGFIHDECAQARLDNFQAHFKPEILQPGMFVKSAIKVTRDGSVEHMWIKIESIGSDSVTGTLDSDPLISEELIGYGDTITVKFTEISELIKP